MAFGKAEQAELDGEWDGKYKLTLPPPRTPEQREADEKAEARRVEREGAAERKQRAAEVFEQKRKDKQKQLGYGLGLGL